MSFGEKLFYAILFFSIAMVNPPILQWVNAYAKNNLLTFGVPTIWLWLEFWFSVMILDFIIAAFTIKSWNTKKMED